MAETNRNKWEDRSYSGSRQQRDTRDDRFNRDRDDYSSNYGNQSGETTYGAAGFRSDYEGSTPYGDNYRGGTSDNTGFGRRNERRDDYTDLDRNRGRSENMGSGYDPYDYGQTVGSFNQGKDGSYSHRAQFGDDHRYERDRNQRRGSGYDDRDAGYDSEYNRSYGRRSADDYGADDYRSDYHNQHKRRDAWYHTGWDHERNRGGSNRNRRDNDRDWWDRTTDEVASWFGDDDAQRRREADRRSGPHRGKGPKGYQRSDERIKDDINDRLSDDPFIDASEIDVNCENCEVVLSGNVSSREEKRRAEDVAERVSGVKNVENRLRVKSTHRSDGATVYKDRD